MNIIDAIKDERIFRPLFKDLSTWQAWEVYLGALFGLGIEGKKARALFKEATGREKIPVRPFKESFLICGRRSGKSFMSALIASFLAAFKDWSEYLSVGEKGWIFIIAVDKAQAGIIKNYISGIFNQIKVLRPMIKKETVETLELKNGINICVKPCSFRAIRGYTILAAILEELAFWRFEEDSANQDREIINAIRPALATIPESILIGISTPYARQGVLYEAFKNYYGQNDDRVLVWKAPTKIMNPTIDQGLINSALNEDYSAAAAEWLAEWRSDVTGFIDPDALESVIIPGRYELPRVAGINYYGFIDPSGGRADSFTLAIAHAEKEKIILDLVRERKPPFKPQDVAEEFSAILKSYGIDSIFADRYAGEWVVQAFEKFGIRVRPAELTASELYLELLPMINQGSVELLDNQRLRNQFLALERKTRTGGKDLVTHGPGGHDDLVNGAAGACVMAKRGQAANFEILWVSL